MKKIISKFALVGVAVTALFTSCVVDDIQTSFDLASAVCNVNVKVLYALDQSDVTSQATISSKYGNGAKITVPANANKTVVAEALAVTASFKSLPAQTQTVNIATLLPGGVATYDVIFVFGGTEDLYYDPRPIYHMDYDKTEYLYNEHYASHRTEKEGWHFNSSEFLLTGVVNYLVMTGSRVKSVDPADDPIVKSFADAIEKNDPFYPVPSSLNIQVSAWAKYKVWQTVGLTETNVELYEVNKVLGTENKLGTYVYEKYNSNSIQYKEEAIDEHYGHYVHGHGLHGGATNAGGGIIFGE